MLFFFMIYFYFFFLESNPLQHTYLIKVDDIEKIGETATAIKNLDYLFIQNLFKI